MYDDTQIGASIEFGYCTQGAFKLCTLHCHNIQWSQITDSKEMLTLGIRIFLRFLVVVYIFSSNI